MSLGLACKAFLSPFKGSKEMEKSPPDSSVQGISLYKLYDMMILQKKKMRLRFLKRPFDVVLSFLGIIISLPLWLFFSFLIWIEDGKPVFFKQERVGKNGRIFKAIKFRSMIKGAEKDEGPVQAKENDPRTTKMGRILRATAMDELPQLINIFKADMSFVGPRALRPEEIETDEYPNKKALTEIHGYKERHSIKPGLTGLAQIYLPPDAPRPKKFRYDRLYIKKQSFWLDLKIILLSFWITFRARWESRQKKL